MKVWRLPHKAKSANTRNNGNIKLNFMMSRSRELMLQSIMVRLWLVQACNWIRFPFETTFDVRSEVINAYDVLFSTSKCQILTKIC